MAALRTQCSCFGCPPHPAHIPRGRGLCRVPRGPCPPVLPSLWPPGLRCTTILVGKPDTSELLSAPPSVAVFMGAQRPGLSPAGRLESVQLQCCTGTPTGQGVNPWPSHVALTVSPHPTQPLPCALDSDQEGGHGLEASSAHLLMEQGSGHSLPGLLASAVNDQLGGRSTGTQVLGHLWGLEATLREEGSSRASP